MIILLITAIIYIGIFFFICILSQFVEMKISDKLFNRMLILLTISFCILAFFSWDGHTDSSGWDINRYYIDINNLRGHDISYAFNHCLYKESYVTVLLFYFVSRLNNNAWLQVISTFFSLSVLNKILIYEKKVNKFKSSTIFLYYLFYYAIVSFATVLLGVRWILACSLCAFGGLLEKKNAYYFPFLIYAVAFFVHYGIVLFFIARATSLIKKRYIQIIIPVIYAILLYYGETLFNGTSLEYVYTKFTIYENSTNADIRLKIVYIVAALLFILIEFVLNKKYEVHSITNQNLLIASICAISNYHLFTRTLGLYYYLSHEEIMTVLEDKSNVLIRFIFYIIIVGMYAYQIVFMKTFWGFVI